MGIFDLAGLLVRHGLLDELGERRLVADPAVGAAGDVDHLAVGARVAALGADRVELGGGELADPGREPLGVQGGVEVLVEGDPLGHRLAVERRDHRAAHLEVDVDADDLVGGVACRLELLVARPARERLVHGVVELERGLGRRHGLLGGGDDGVAAELLVGARTGDGEHARLLVIGPRGVEGAGAVGVELVDRRAERLLERRLVVGHGQRRGVGRGIRAAGDEVADQPDRPDERLVGAEDGIRLRLRVDGERARLGLVGPVEAQARDLERVGAHGGLDAVRGLAGSREGHVDPGDGGAGVVDVGEGDGAGDVADDEHARGGGERDLQPAAAARARLLRIAAEGGAGVDGGQPVARGGADRRHAGGRIRPRRALRAVRGGRGRGAGPGRRAAGGRGAHVHGAVGVGPPATGLGARLGPRRALGPRGAGVRGADGGQACGVDGAQGPGVVRAGAMRPGLNGARGNDTPLGSVVVHARSVPSRSDMRPVRGPDVGSGGLYLHVRTQWSVCMCFSGNSSPR